MLCIDIPGRAPLELAHLVLDCNGTVAVDGALLPSVAPRLHQLAPELYIHLLTADTNGNAGDLFADLPVQVQVIAPGNEDLAKARFVQSIGAGFCAAIGNGFNDRLMLKEAALGIGVLQAEGLHPRALLAADVLCPDIASALDLLCIPNRLVATLRS